MSLNSVKQVIDSELYPLGHLAPFQFQVTLPATTNSPAIEFPVSVMFTSHCVSEGKKSDSPSFSDEGGRTRHFSESRHQLSFRLPDIIKGIPDRNCYTGKHRNHFTIEIVNEDNKKFEYHIFFRTRKAKPGIKLSVESAYPKQAARSRMRRIKGKVLLSKVYRNTLK